MLACVIYPDRRYGICRVECLGCQGTGTVSESAAIWLQGERSCALVEMERELKAIRRWLQWDDRVQPGEPVEFVVAGVRL